MRRIFLIGAIVLTGLVASGSAIAEYVHPGRIIIGYGGGGGTTTGGTTTNAAFGPECVLSNEIDCECYPGVTVLDACLKSGVKTQCLTPDMPYLDVEQDEPVVVDLGKHTLAKLTCTGESKATAYIRLPLPK